jgi:hypothetical protein
MSTPADRLREPLRRAGSARQLAPLLRALGLQPELKRLRRSAWPDVGLHDADGVRGVVLAGRRDGLLALLLELDADPLSGRVVALARQLRGHNPAVPCLLLFAGPGYRRLAIASPGLDGETRHVVVDRAAPRAADLDLLEELRARDGEPGLALALRHARALDRGRLGERFFRDFRAIRGVVARAWRGLPDDAVDDREQLALLLLSRLMFLYFLQREGHLAGDTEFLPARFRQWRARAGRGTFYRRVLRPLFFGALNTRPPHRSAAASSLGPLPYLNGGLFERHALERRWPRLGLDDAVLCVVFDELLGRYRFTSREAPAGEGEAGVDPEMLGRVFEGLMSQPRRGDTGTFFTPSDVVDRITSAALVARLVTSCALDEPAARAVVAGNVAALPAAERARASAALAGFRVLDPACGSGAFLLGALMRLATARRAVAPGPGYAASAGELRREIVAGALCGVDLQSDAALLCALRLWLALAADLDTERTPPPLPTLDLRIRQGDALIDPLDLIDAGGARTAGVPLDPDVRRAARALADVTARYLAAEPGSRIRLRRRVAAAEVALARAWIRTSARFACARVADLRARARDRDLFGAALPEAPAVRRSLGRWRNRLRRIVGLEAALRDARQLPFFSFPVHLPESTHGFDLILSNPPWLRAHRWPESARRVARGRYEVCDGGGAGQVDMALLFLERSIRLLAPGGAAGMLLPAKVLRSGYGGGGRALLLRETRIHEVRDHALDQRSIFRADAFAAELVVTRAAAAGHGRPVRVSMIRRGRAPLEYEAAQADLPIDPADTRSPWLLAPPACVQALRRMRAAGPELAAVRGLPIRRGVVTGANDALIIRRATRRIGDLAEVEAEGYERSRRRGARSAAAGRFHGLVEASALRPILRGSDITAWRHDIRRHLVWCHDDRTAAPAPPPPRAAAYLERHRRALLRRSGRRGDAPLGAVFRLGVDALGAKVAWPDLAADLQAVAIGATVRSLGRDTPLIPLNTTYYVPVESDEDAMALAALLNSAPVRTFARAIAERAKDARFRFMARCIGRVPIPPAWSRGPLRTRLVSLATSAHAAGALATADRAVLDATVAEIYGLDDADRRALAEFGQWLDGATP